MQTLTKVKPVLRYPGGKQRLLKYLVPLFPERFDYYAEPFVGGGSVFFYVKNHNLAKHYWINDVNQNLYNFWFACQQQDANDLMCEQLEDYVQSDIYFKKCLFNSTNKQDKLSEAMFFFRNRCSYSGTTECGGFSIEAAQNRFTPSSIDRLRVLPEFLKDVYITETDYSHHLGRIPYSTHPYTAFIYLDPPYEGITGLYKEGYKGFDHERLAIRLKGLSQNFLLSYNDTPYIRELYSWANIQTIDAIYGTNNRKDNKAAKRSSELVITNYGYSHPTTSV